MKCKCMLVEVGVMDQLMDLMDQQLVRARALARARDRDYRKLYI